MIEAVERGMIGVLPLEPDSEPGPGGHTNSKVYLAARPHVSRGRADRPVLCNHSEWGWGMSGRYRSSSITLRLFREVKHLFRWKANYFKAAIALASFAVLLVGSGADWRWS